MFYCVLFDSQPQEMYIDVALMLPFSSVELETLMFVRDTPSIVSNF